MLRVKPKTYRLCIAIEIKGDRVCLFRRLPTASYTWHQPLSKRSYPVTRSEFKRRFIFLESFPRTTQSCRFGFNVEYVNAI